MTVPADHILGATGIEVEVKDNGDGTRTHVYHAEDVHDFAWTSSPEFVEFNDRVARHSVCPNYSRWQSA